MGVQALDADACSPHAPRRLDGPGLDGDVPAARCVGVMGALKSLRVDEFLETVHAAVTLESAHRVVQVGVDEPVEGWHRGAITKVGLVLDHHGTTVTASNDHRAAPREWSSEEFLYRGEIGRCSVTKCAQRQNSRVRTRRATKLLAPPDFDAAGVALLGNEVLESGEASGWKPGSPVVAAT